MGKLGHSGIRSHLDSSSGYVLCDHVDRPNMPLGWHSSPKACNFCVTDVSGYRTAQSASFTRKDQWQSWEIVRFAVIRMFHLAMSALCT